MNFSAHITNVSAVCRRGLPTAFIVAGVSIGLWISQSARAYDSEVNLDWRGTYAKIDLSDDQFGTIASPLGFNSSYLVSLSERLSFGLGYGMTYAAQTVLLHGPSTFLRTQIYGGRSLSITSADINYSVKRKLAIYLPVGVSGTFYDFKNIFGSKGLVKRDAAEVTGFSLGTFAGGEVELPAGTEMLWRIGCYYVLSGSSSAAAEITQVQTIFGLTKEF